MYSSSLNPNVVKTALDDVFMQQWNGETRPGYVNALSGIVFNQEGMDSAAEIQEIFKGVGEWSERTEEEEVASSDPRITNQKTLNAINFANSVDIPKNFYDDSKHGAIDKMMEDFGRKARVTRDKNAFAVYRDGFDTTTTADDSYLFANDHTTISGATVDNLGTAAISPDSLNDGITKLGEQKDQAGVIMGSTPKTLLVPMALYKSACEIVDSELLADSADNNINVYSSKYGIYVATTPYLGAAAGGSDTAWFLLGDNNAITRFERQGIQTDLVDYKFQRNNTYIYKGEFREVVGAWDYVGAWASTGLT